MCEFEISNSSSLFKLMGHGASIPESEEEALAQGYTTTQIEKYKVLVVELARQNALRALELRNQQITDEVSEETKEVVSASSRQESNYSRK